MKEALFERMDRAVEALLSVEPFWAVVLADLPRVARRASREHQYFSTNGCEIQYYPENLGDWTAGELAFGLAHEVLHVLAGHHARRNGRDIERWDRACDYAVHSELVPRIRASGLRVPDLNILYDPRFDDWSAEAIYRTLEEEDEPDQPEEENEPEPEPGQDGEDEPEPEPGQDGDAEDEPEPGQDGDAEDDAEDEPGQNRSSSEPEPANGDAEDEPGQNRPSSEPEPNGDADDWRIGDVLDAPQGSEDAERDLGELLERIVVAARSAGIGDHLDDAFERALGRIRTSVDWRAALAHLYAEACRAAGFEDYTWERPVPYLLEELDVYLPSGTEREPPALTVAIDTSGSVDDDQLGAMSDALRALRADYEGMAIEILYCDTAIRHRQVIRANDPIQLEPYGGGGTRLEPVFAAEAARGREALIYMTDLEVLSIPPRPHYPVVWCYTGPYEVPPVKPSYGRLVIMRTWKEE